jgi:DNA-binding transcriptional MerR regulator
MLKIGDFARLSHVPVKTLRYYDDQGLITPARAAQRAERDLVATDRR